MYCELTITSRKSLPPDLAAHLARWFRGAAPVDQVVSVSQFDPDFQSIVLYSAATPSNLVLVWQSDAKTMKLHLESASDSSSYPDLKRCITEIRGRTQEFLKSLANREDSCRAEIWHDADHLLTGRTRTSREALEKTIDERILKLLVPAAVTFALSVAFTKDWLASLLALAAAAITALVWLSAPVLYVFLGFPATMIYEA